MIRAYTKHKGCSMRLIRDLDWRCIANAKHYLLIRLSSNERYAIFDGHVCVERGTGESLADQDA